MKRNEVYLKHIIDEISFLIESSKKLNYDSFLESEMYTRAFSRSFEIIGEAVKNLTEEFRQEHDEIEWKKIAGMRDIIIHHYFSVDYEIIWNAIQNNLPSIKTKIQFILEKEK